MLEIDRFYNTSPDIAFEREDLREVYVMNGLRILQNSSNISHKTSISIKSCRVNEAFFSDCFKNLIGNRFVDTVSINDIIPDGPNWASPLCDFLSQSTKLKHLDLSGSHLSVSDANRISQAVIANEVLATLDLSRTQINKSANYIANMIICNTSLVSLSLRSNSMSPADLNIIFGVLHLSRNLRSISVSDSKFDMQVALTFSTALHNKDSVVQLSSLDISCCQIDNSILKCLVLGLRKNQSKSLNIINLMGNNLSDESLPQIIDILQWPSINEIILNGNGLTSEVIAAIESAKGRVNVHF